MLRNSETGKVIIVKRIFVRYINICIHINGNQAHYILLILLLIYIDKHPPIFNLHWIQKLIPLVADLPFGRTLPKIGNQFQMVRTNQTPWGTSVTGPTHLTQAKMSSERPEELEKVKQTHNTFMKRTQCCIVAMNFPMPKPTI